MVPHIIQWARYIYELYRIRKFNLLFETHQGVTEDTKKTTIFYYVNGSEYNYKDTEFVYKEKTTN